MNSGAGLDMPEHAMKPRWRLRRHRMDAQRAIMNESKRTPAKKAKFDCIYSYAESRSKMASKFENRTTIVKGFFVDKTNGATNPFEMNVHYVRSNESAIKAIAETLSDEDKERFVIAVSEIINEKPKPIRYSDSKILDYGRDNFRSEEEAENAKRENEQVRKIKAYSYECAFWAHDAQNDEYVTDYVHDESPLSMTKIDMRAFLANSARKLIGFNYDVLSVHNCKKEEITYYVVISDYDLKHCIIK